MHLVPVGDRRYAQFERLRHESGLVHAFSTRPADVSPRAGGDTATRAERRQTMARDWGCEGGLLHVCLQVHQTSIATIGHAGPGGLLPNCDGVMVSAPSVPVMTFSADCPLVLIYDARRAVVGLAHASWRCTVAQIVTQLVQSMTTRLACRPGELLAGIGPGAGPCCYEVQSDVYDAAAQLPDRDRLFARPDRRMFFDLWEANRAQLIAAGVDPKRIEVAGICTLCHNDVFFSYRREGAGCGHFGLLAAIRRNRD